MAIAIGANVRGNYGHPTDSLRRSLVEMGRAGINIKGISSTYLTKPYGYGLQPHYYNAVAVGHSTLPPAVVLRNLKRIERAAGRRLGRRNGPRPLDLDVLYFRGQRLGWGMPKGVDKPKRRRGDLIIPHPEIAKRGFVLVPLLEVCPHWVHPVTGVTGGQLLARLGAQARGVTVFGPPLPLF
ncbi:MAG: 2-amino-4-hydroxy-6-hydroxymethyldihydropteridine diphosphokinase [Hyphomicrobiaceae bacterium]